MNRLKRRWVVTGVLWGVVLAITGWNLRLVDQIQNRRQSLETMRMDKGYLTRNAEGIDLVLAQQNLLVHRVKSFGLGFLVVENDLKRLAWNLGLEETRIDAKNEFQDTRPVPVNVATRGAIPALVQWLATVEEQFPFLKIAHMEMSIDPKDRTGRLRSTFTYRYVLVQNEKEGPI